MIELYNFKLIQSGRHIEIYRYKDKRILKGYERKERKIDENKQDDKPKQVSQSTDEEQKQKTKFSISRTRTNIRRITNSNPHLNKFLTLTFAKSMSDVKTANYHFKQAMKRILRAKPKFEYISVLEFQKDTDFHGNVKPDGGSVHYHLLCNIDEPKSAHLKERFAWERWFQMRFWKNGFVKVKDVTTVDNMGAYFCKYLSKDMFDERMFNKKKFFCSQSLKKPEELTGWKAKRLYEHYLPDMKMTFEKTFENEFAGTVEYEAYVLK